MIINENKLKARLDEEIAITRAYMNDTPDEYEKERCEEKIKILDSIMDLVVSVRE